VGRLQPEIDALEARLEQTAQVLAESEQENAVLHTRTEDREQHYQEQIRKLETAEKRL